GELHARLLNRTPTLSQARAAIAPTFPVPEGSPLACPPASPGLCLLYLHPIRHSFPFPPVPFLLLLRPSVSLSACGSGPTAFSQKHTFLKHCLCKGPSHLIRCGRC